MINAQLVMKINYAEYKIINAFALMDIMTCNMKQNANNVIILGINFII